MRSSAPATRITESEGSQSEQLNNLEELLLSQEHRSNSALPSRRETELETTTVENGSISQEAHASYSLSVPDLVQREEEVQENEYKPPALAFYSSTPALVKWLVPFCILCTHALFLYGQIKPMWRLVEDVQVDVWANLTKSDKEARVAFDALQIPYHNHFTYSTTKDVQTFTYTFAVRELWKAQGLPGKFMPRLAAVGLAMFSGVWPHLKLLMLLATWWFSTNAPRRQRILTSLSILGKWSMCDVLVVCIMVGVLDIDWIFTGPSLQQGITTHLPEVVALIQAFTTRRQICGKALKYSCENPSKAMHKLQCNACLTTLKTAFDHPDYAKGILRNGIQTDGGGRAQLFVAGLPGIYVFCVAVVFSIVLSLVVDRYDQLAVKAAAIALAEQEREDQNDLESRRLLRNGRACEDDGEEEDANALESFSREGLVQQSSRDHRSAADIEFDRALLGRVASDTPHPVLRGTSYFTVLLVIAGCIYTTMQRSVNGGGPDLVREILHAEFTKPYSFLQLGWATGMSGGWDLLLMGTFYLFIVVGPFIRSILCVSAVHTCSKRRQKRLSMWSDFFSAFCAWEVFIAAVVMVHLLMPSITGTIVTSQLCKSLSHENTCLEVEFEVFRWIGTVLLGGVLLPLVALCIQRL